MSARKKSSDRAEASVRRQAGGEGRRNLDTQNAINSLLKIALEPISLEEILRKALDLTLLIPWLSLESCGGMFLTDEDSDELVMTASRGLNANVGRACSRVPFGKCVCGRAALSQELQFEASITESHEIKYEGITAHGHYCVPIVFAKKTLGVICMYLRENHARDEHEVEFLNAIANALAGIIQRKRIEKEQERLIEELRETIVKVSRSQKIWLDTFDGIRDLISIHDADFNIIKCNRAFAEHFGLEPRDVLNRKCHDFFHRDCRPVSNCPLKVTIAENRPVTTDIHDRKVNRIFRISTFPFQFHDAGFNGVIHVAKDITEERTAEMRLIMSERLIALGQMASGIAHEINNPLSAIAGCTEGLLNRVAKNNFDPELFYNYLKIIEEEILRCKNITGGILSYVRKSADEPEEVDLNETVAKALEILGFQGRLARVRVVNRSASGKLVVRGNEGELRQVFLSILTNALDAMEDSGAVTITTEDTGSSAVVGISDSGPGILPEHINRIFDLFFTTRSNKGGTGLGLSIAGKIISNHNGSINVTSEPEKGSTFIITLPR